MTTDTKPLALRVAEQIDEQADFSLIKRSAEAPRDFLLRLSTNEARALAALLREAGDGWRPIEIAPRDRPVWAWGEGWHWGGEGKLAYVHSDYNGHKDVVTRDGRCGAPFQLGSKDAPTHWHPLPAPPAAGGKDAVA